MTIDFLFLNLGFAVVKLFVLFLVAYVVTVFVYNNIVKIGRKYRPDDFNEFILFNYAPNTKTILVFLIIAAVYTMFTQPTTVVKHEPTYIPNGSAITKKPVNESEPLVNSRSWDELRESLDKYEEESDNKFKERGIDLSK